MENNNIRAAEFIGIVGAGMVGFLIGWAATGSFMGSVGIAMVAAIVATIMVGAGGD